jgi:hypothetical protein
MEYVVRAVHDDDTYAEYLLNLAYIKEGFNQLYQERAQEMFGKDYFSIDKEQFDAVRKSTCFQFLKRIRVVIDRIESSLITRA